MKVYGNTIIQNDDPNGGITIASKGYLNLVCGAERVDLVGKFTETPSKDAISTFTTKVFPGVGVMNKSTVPGDVYFESAAGAYYVYGKTLTGSSTSKTDGFKQDVLLGNRTRTVAGLENIAITGTQTVKGVHDLPELICHLTLHYPQGLMVSCGESITKMKVVSPLGTLWN